MAGRHPKNDQLFEAAKSEFWLVSILIPVDYWWILVVCILMVFLRPTFSAINQ